MFNDTIKINLESIDIEYNANIICKIYGHQKIQKFVPCLNKSRRNGNNVTNIFIIDEYANIPMKEQLGSVLKKVLYANIQNDIIKLENGILYDELKKALEILKMHMNNLNACNNIEELAKKNMEYEILKEKYDECEKKGNFEEIIDYKEVATNMIKLLGKATQDFNRRKKMNDEKDRNGERKDFELTNAEKLAKKLHDKVCEKFGIKVDNRQKWVIRKDLEQYEYNREGRDNKDNRDNKNNIKDDIILKNNKETYKYVPKYKSFIDNIYKTNEKHGNYVPPHKQENKQENKQDNKQERKLESNENEMLKTVELGGTKQMELKGSWNNNINLKKILLQETNKDKNKDKNDEKSYKKKYNDEDDKYDTWIE